MNSRTKPTHAELISTLQSLDVEKKDKDLQATIDDFIKQPVNSAEAVIACACLVLTRHPTVASNPNVEKFYQFIFDAIETVYDNLDNILGKTKGALFSKEITADKIHLIAPILHPFILNQLAKHPELKKRIDELCQRIIELPAPAKHNTNVATPTQPRARL